MDKQLRGNQELQILFPIRVLHSTFVCVPLSSDGSKLLLFAVGWKRLEEAYAILELLLRVYLLHLGICRGHLIHYLYLGASTRIV
jgi:hypothetical protein